MKRASRIIIVCVCLLLAAAGSQKLLDISAGAQPSLPSLIGWGHDFYTILSYDSGDSRTRVIVTALEPDTLVTLDTNWDDLPEYSWSSGTEPYQTHVFEGDDSTIPPGTHIHGSKPITVAQWHGIEPEPWNDSGALSLLPYESWGTQYIAGAKISWGGKIEITAPTPGTTVLVDTNNDGSAEHAWISTTTERHHLLGGPYSEIPVSNVTATAKIQVASVHSVHDVYAGTPSYAILHLPLESLGKEFYSLQQYPNFPGVPNGPGGQGGDVKLAVLCPHLPSQARIQLDIRSAEVGIYDLTSYEGNSELAWELDHELFDSLDPVVSYANSTTPAEAVYVTFACLYSQSVDAEFGAMIIPVNHWGTEYSVIEDPDDSQLDTHKRLIQVIAPTIGTHITVDTDHDGSWEYEWTSTISSMNTTFTNLPAGSSVKGNFKFIAQQLVYPENFQSPRAYELLPIRSASTHAQVNIDPDTLNLGSNGRWITAYIELPEGYNAADIDAATILLNGTIAPELDPKYDFVTDSSEYLVDHDGDGIIERMVKFDRATVEAFILNSEVTGDSVALTITGELLNETSFEGSDHIRIHYRVHRHPGPRSTG